MMKRFGLFFIALVISLLPLTGAASSEAWSYPEVLSEEAKSKSAISAVTYSSMDEVTGITDTRVTLFYKDKSKGNLMVIVSNNINESNNRPTQWNAPRTVKIKDGYHPAYSPVAYVANGRLYVSFIKGGDKYDKDSFIHINVKNTQDLLDSNHTWSTKVNTIPIPSHWKYEWTGKGLHIFEEGLNVQVFNPPYNEYEEVTFQATYKKQGYTWGRGNYWKTNRAMAINHSGNDMDSYNQDWYGQNVSRAGSAAIHSNIPGTDLHSLHTVRVIGHELYHDYIDATNVRYSTHKGDLIRDTKDKKIQNVLHEKPTLINLNDNGADATHLFFVKQNNTIQTMRYDEVKQRWIGPNTLDSPVYPIKSSPPETKHGVSVLEIDGVMHLFYVDKKSNKVNHVYKIHK